MDTETFREPPVLTNPSGDERSVGFELEFTGVEMDTVAELIQSLYGGSIVPVSTYEFDIADTTFGDFKLELDAQIIRDKKYEKLLKKVGMDAKKLKNIRLVEDSLKDLASSVVPFEIVTPPIPLSQMQEMNKLMNALRHEKVKGTGSSVIYAFGMHLNPEISDDAPVHILNHLRAYVLLDPWIRQDADIDISRRLTPYINEYKKQYITHILDPEYSPDLQTLIRDYFRFENSRNRPLDLLPLFMHLDEKTTSGLIEEDLTSSRPTYHYRLPNCSLEDENWTLASEWNRWVLVEELAADETELNQYSRAWLKMREDTMIGFEKKWVELMSRRLNEGD